MDILVWITAINSTLTLVLLVVLLVGMRSVKTVIFEKMKMFDQMFGKAKKR